MSHSSIVLMVVVALSSFGFASESQGGFRFHNSYCSTPHCLEQKISPDNGRYQTFLYALQILTQRQAKVIVETGTARGGKHNCLGDGCSTLIFSEWASKNGAVLFSVDISKEALLSAERDLEASARGVVQFVQSDSVEFLRNFNQPIDFLYLDSYDYEDHNPTPSQQHHLNEIIAAYPWLTQNTVVMIDDCDLPNGGKGKLVIDYLLQRGWKIAAKAYQVVMVKQ